VAATLDVSPDHEHALLAEPASIRRALELLIRRAFESATQPHDSREPLAICEVVVTSIDVGSAIEIEVADSGPALSDPVRKWLNDQARNDPHASGDTPEGAGLALAAVRAATARIDGTLWAANCPEGGVAITLRLPRRQAQRLAA
jgi:sensor histidine kinase regulating citrate/malate metabolism